MLKKIILLFIILCSVSGCESTKKDERIQIVCTAFPQYNWTSELTKGAEDMFNITLLTDNGTDIHSFQPSANDIIRISTCDLLIYTGGESEKWVSDAAENSDAKIIDMLSCSDSEDSHGHDHAPDEHTWLSLRDSAVICNEIANTLKELLPEKKDLFQSNAKIYTESLDELDKEYQLAVDEAKNKTLVFADRFPFSPMTEDYNLTCYAAFPGCSAESEASFETIANLASAIDENNLDYVFVTDNSGLDLAKTVIENTSEKNQQILSLNSMQTVTEADLKSGLSYLDIMKKNLETLKIALN